MGTPSIKYHAEAVLDEGAVKDIAIHLPDGKTWHLWGRDGAGREAALAQSVEPGTLPVLLGTGLGICLEQLLERGPVAVVDQEADILALTSVRERLGGHPNLRWLQGAPEAVLEQLATLRRDENLGAVVPVRIPLYQRLHADYKTVAESLDAMGEFQRAMNYPKFESKKPRVLVLARPYFLYQELLAAFERMGVEHKVLELEDTDRGSSGFVEQLLLNVASFRPDFALTVNHFGLDREGCLAGLLEEVGLPLASWFVDSPQLILYRYPRQTTSSTCVFTYDAGSISWLEDTGFEHVHYLPLATDVHRFAPGQEGPAAWKAEVSFVGDSLTTQVEGMVETAGLSERFREALPELAESFAQSDEFSVARFLEREHLKYFCELEELPGLEAKLACEKALTFTSARQYRLHCVNKLMGFEPLIAGDAGWEQVLGEGGWRAAGYLEYYRDLPLFYPMSEVNFNCTSVQMKGAVNQRVFDVPACGGFLVTDWREQMEKLFDLQTEAVCYRDPEEIPDLVAAWLANPAGRRQVAKQARKRILAEHTYEHRLEKMLAIMRSTFEN